MVTKRTIRALVVIVLGILLFIVAKWLLLILIGAFIFGWIIFATEAAKEYTTPARPPAPVSIPPVQPAATSKPSASYAQGYRAQSPQKHVTPGFPFGPNNPEPQPHEASPGERYEEPLVQYPEVQL